MQHTVILMISRTLLPFLPLLSPPQPSLFHLFLFVYLCCPLSLKWVVDSWDGTVCFDLLHQCITWWASLTTGECCNCPFTQILLWTSFHYSQKQNHLSSTPYVHLSCPSCHPTSGFLAPSPIHSSVNSAHSSASRSSGGGSIAGLSGGGGSQPHSPTSSSSSSSSVRYRSSLPHQPLPPGGIAAHRLSSVSSHDSGFVSQDANIYSKPPSPMPSDITSQVHALSARLIHAEVLADGVNVVFFLIYCYCRSHQVQLHQRPRRHASQSVNAARLPL